MTRVLEIVAGVLMVVVGSIAMWQATMEILAQPPIQRAVGIIAVLSAAMAPRVWRQFLLWRGRRRARKVWR